MKIISKYKDYYDYLVGVYGIDEKLILDRTEFFPTSRFISPNDSKVIFFICGYQVECLYRNGKFYYGDDLEQFENKKTYKWRWFSSEDNKDYYTLKINRVGKDEYISILKKPILDKNNTNEKLDCPILIYNIFGEYEYKGYKLSKFPILKDYDIVNVFRPEKLWQMLYDFLSKTKDIPNLQTDKEKIISKGFDYKHSFRNTK